MAGWNGSGAFTRLYSWVADTAAGIDISSSRMDADTNNIVTNGFNNCLTRDGQGAATANLPMNGFKHTNVGNGSAVTDYVAVGQLQAPGTPASTALIPAGAYLGEFRETALPETLLVALMPGWHVCDGSTRPRTDPLWQATGAIAGGNWVWGVGNGTTTYTLPDRRGRDGIGKDDMGGSAANRITNAVCGIVGTTLGSAGGDQHAQTDTVGINITGSIALTGSVSAVSTPTDPGHSHTTTVPAGSGITAGATTSDSGNTTQNYTSSTSTTGITVATVITNTMAINNTQTITAASALTGSSQNVPPAVIVNVVIFTGA